jgi:hypothetical protein
MESPSIRASVETLCGYIQALDNEQKCVRGINSNALLMPIETVMTLLHTSLREIFDAARQLKPFLPVDKPIAKLFATPAKIPTRGTLLRLLKELPHQVFLQNLIEQGKEDFVWLTGNGWHSLLSSQFFINQASRDFWISFFQKAKALNIVGIRAENRLVLRLQAYAKAPVVERFGCSTARTIMDARLERMRDEEISPSDEVIRQAVVADRLAVLLRVLAWVAAEMVVDIWEMIKREGK